MQKLVKTSLAVFVSSMLAACSGTGGGSFDVDNVEVTKSQANNDDKNKTQDIKTEPRKEEAPIGETIMQPALGYEVPIPRRNWHFRAKEASAGFTKENVTAITESSTEIPHFEEVKLLDDDGVGTVIYTHNPNGKATQKRDLDYVRSGYVYTFHSDRKFSENIFKTGAAGYVYYRGTNPSTAVPVSPTVTYQGTWDFVSDAVDGRDLEEKGFDTSLNPAGNRAGALSNDENVYTETDAQHKTGHTSEFSVNFADKKLTGNLYKNQRPDYLTKKQEIIHRYSLEADISGNRFRGKADAKDSNDVLFGRNSDYLEGGFYGPNSEELAGKFLANDNSLFVVFGAKREKVTDEKVEKVLDTVKIDLNDFTAKSIDNFGNATKLLIDGKEFSLLSTNSDFTTNKVFNAEKNIRATICCSNLDYVKFGILGEDKNNSLILQGERTAAKDIPTSGEVQYKGTWDGYISDSAVWSTNASNKEGGSRANFNVDFGNKQIRGQLIAEERVDPTITILGSIDQNGFTAKASTSANGFNIDPANTGSSKIVHFKDVEVNGAFYGKNAAELGGSLYSSENKVGAVFGAKRQQ